MRADFPFTSRPFTPVAGILPLTINTVGGGSSDPFPIVDISTMANRPNQLKRIEKIAIVFSTTITFGAGPAVFLDLSYIARDTTTKVLIKRIDSGTASTIVFTPPDTGPLLGAGEFPILEAAGAGFDGKIVNFVEIHLGLDR